MHELVNSFDDKSRIQCCVTIQSQCDIGVDHAQKCGCISLMAAAHIPVVFRHLGEQRFEELLLLLVDGRHCPEGVAIGWREPHCELHPVKGMVFLGKIKVDGTNRSLCSFDIALVIGIFLQCLEKFIEIRT